MKHACNKDKKLSIILKKNNQKLAFRAPTKTLKKDYNRLHIRGVAIALLFKCSTINMYNCTLHFHM